MAKFCSECGEPLPIPNPKFCSECGAEQFSNGAVSTRIDGSVTGSTIISGKTVKIGNEKPVPCPDCFDTGIEHKECPTCNGTGIGKEYIGPPSIAHMTSEEIEGTTKFMDKLTKDMNPINKFLTKGYLVLSAAAHAGNSEVDSNYKKVKCPDCKGNTKLPTDHELFLNSGKTKKINSCPTCKGTKTIYLPD